ncbi:MULTISPECIES: hypothetical protein [Burkholderia]|jgi:hypothetical protein|uniref:Uncharacterized protein n=9 Tax=Burkholderia TaxID=32008 RepID=A0A6H9SRM6_9BURK|nr:MULTISPECIES: hypothetical protein [Burkholderia]AKE05585.1 hypothetical protein XM57_23395 [Burkholderia cepacia]MBR8143928.1 hypothetical protein [Burkholderia vietnamiensis]MEB2504141.1 hypothetical protein [Burkholderia anthinoferrum]MEB2530354.1 hypothetical protein [Burkholderia anthinoferrum]MEB2562896.1 hypothetical protein [Burkholderia anthinoferrum]MEB2580299.1 hypothetical protein [Burkholderia anthinoferrum]
MSSSIGSSGVSQAGSQNADMVGQMQAMANQNNAMTMAAMQINMQQQETSALASVGNNGAKNIADAAKGQ